MSVGDEREARLLAAHAWLAGEGGPCRVKLCGMHRAEDIAAANACLPDMVGFVVDFPKSHRSVVSGELGELSSQVDGRIFRVSVTVDLPVGRLVACAESHVDIVQLHGREDDAYIRDLRSHVPVSIIQAFRIREHADVERARRSLADLVLLDAGQGSGRQFDWSLIAGIDRPYILAGGLTPDNVSEAVRTLRPWGVDLSSGIETDRRKDPAKMAATVAAVRSTS